MVSCRIQGGVLSAQPCDPFVEDHHHCSGLCRVLYSCGCGSPSAGAPMAHHEGSSCLAPAAPEIQVWPIPPLKLTLQCVKDANFLHLFALPMTHTSAACVWTRLMAAELICCCCWLHDSHAGQTRGERLPRVEWKSCCIGDVSAAWASQTELCNSMAAQETAWNTEGADCKGPGPDPKRDHSCLHRCPGFH